MIAILFNVFLVLFFFVDLLHKLFSFELFLFFNIHRRRVIQILIFKLN